MMARKNILSNLMDGNKTFTAVNSDSNQSTDERQAMSYKGVGALGAVTRSIDALAARAGAAQAIEEKLAAGEVIVDLMPDQIEDSFISDRLVMMDGSFTELVEAIRIRGQDSPILVRPHPTMDGKFQIAFGHRRARVARELGRPVRAIIRKLDDRDHVIAQGQENAARADLSFIERTIFAHKLVERGFDRETVMAALNADKTTVSKMLSVVKRIPGNVLEKVLGAREVGRDRWHELSTLFETDNAQIVADATLTRATFRDADPGARFDMLVKALKSPPADAVVAATSSTPEIKTWKHGDGAVQASIKDTGKQFTIALKAEKASAFGAYITRSLDRLYAEFEAIEPTVKTGD